MIEIKSFKRLAIVAFSIVIGGCGTNASSIAPQPDMANSTTSRVASIQPDDGGKKGLYVSNLFTSVSLYPAGIHKSNPKPMETITDGTTRPEAMWVDRHGTLYVVNGVNGRDHVSVAEYKQGETEPKRVITNGLTAPAAVAVGRDGTVYVNDVVETNTGVVVIYGRGQSMPERTITLPDFAYDFTPGGMAFDAKGDLLVATLVPETNTVHVFSIAPGSSTPVDLGLKGAGGPAIATDGAGNLYTAGAINDPGTVAIFAPGSTTPFRAFQLGPQINFITVAADGTLYAAVIDQRTGVTGVAEVAPGAGTITNLIDKGNYAYGVALGSL